MSPVRSLDDLDIFCKQCFDNVFASNPFWSIDEQIRHYALLAAIDSYWIVDVQVYDRVVSEHVKNIYPLFQGQKLHEEAVCHVARWTSRQGRIHCESTSERAPLDAAGQIILNARDFSLIDILRQQARSGIFDLEIEDDGKYVSFFPATSSGPPSGAYAENDFCQLQSRAISEWMQSEQNAWKQVDDPIFVQENGRIVLYDIRHIGSIIDHDHLANNVYPTDVMLIDPNASIGGVRISDFNLVMAVLRQWSLLLLQAYRNIFESGGDQCHFMPTYVGRTRGLVDCIHRASGVGTNTVQQIVEWMTWSDSDSMCDIFLQPFFRSYGKCMWSPKIIFGSHSTRNLLKRLLKYPGMTNEVATLVGDRSSYLAEAVGGILKKHGYTVYLESKYSQNGVRGDWDVIAWSRGAPDEALVIECKAYLPPDSSQEMARVSRDRVSAESQIRKGIGVLSQLTAAELTQRFPRIPWNSNVEWFGIVCVPQGLPFLRGHSYEYPVTSIVLLSTRIPEEFLASPSKLVEAHLNWSWLKSPSLEIVGWEEVVISETTFRTPRLSVEH